MAEMTDASMDLTPDQPKLQRIGDESEKAFL